MIIATKKPGKVVQPPLPISGIDASGAEPRETPRRVRSVRPRATIIVRPLHAAAVYPPAAWERAARQADLVHVSGPEDAAWANVEAVLGGWGMPVLDAAFLERAARLKAVFYAAGSVRSFMTEAAWDRGIVLSTAAAANSATTAEFCLGQILFSLKHGWRFIRSPREAWRQAYHYDPLVPGLVGSRVGLVSFGRVAQRIAELLRPFQIEVVAWDPKQPRETFERHGVRMVDLETLISTSDVVSLHLPQIPETHRMIGAPWLARLKPGATLINTSRGDVVDEPALVALLRERTDLTAVLDVTDPEPPRPDSELFELPNIVLTPHLAGSYGPECARMGALAVDELERWCKGEPLQHELTREQAVNLA
jgi:phosphoglycerate dehydrogenase-like enzyme